jgi:hypothetical protein
MKKLILILLLNISLLFSPSSINGTTDPNGRYVILSHNAGFFLNPDTYGFIFPAIEPRQLFWYHAQRQDRPLFILAGSVMGYSITFLTWPFHDRLLHLYGAFWRGAYPEGKILFIGNFYIGFILLNIMILWISFYIFEKIFYLRIKRTVNSELSMYLLMVFIVSNPVTKAFFWTPHQQMFAFLTPLMCIYLLFRFTYLQTPVSGLRLVGIFLLGGVLLLVYGNFILLLPTLIYCFMDQENKSGCSKKRQTLLLKICGLILVFFMPTICWIGILKWNGVVYYNFEIQQYRQLVWIPETLCQSVHLFFQQFLSNTHDYLLTMKELLILFVYSIVIFLSEKIKISEKNEFMKLTLFVFISFFIFYWVLGTYFERLTNTMIPVFVCFWIAALGQRVTGKKFILILSSLALTWHLYVLMSYGPFY